MGRDDEGGLHRGHLEVAAAEGDVTGYQSWAGARSSERALILSIPYGGGRWADRATAEPDPKETYEPGGGASGVGG